jgi:ABC-type glycerol-3-phosphate transport system substrate-binding protein
MTEKTSRLRLMAGMAAIAGMALLSACGGPTPYSHTTTSDVTTTTTPPPPTITTTTTTDQQNSQTRQ